jgi:hypothetical protein
MQEQINQIQDKVDKIHEALIGNEYNDRGLVHRVSEVENYQSKDKKQKWTIAGVWLATVAFIKWFIS